MSHSCTFTPAGINNMHLSGAPPQFSNMEEMGVGSSRAKRYSSQRQRAVPEPTPPLHLGVMEGHYYEPSECSSSGNARSSGVFRGEEPFTFPSRTEPEPSACCPFKCVIDGRLLVSLKHDSLAQFPIRDQSMVTGKAPPPFHRKACWSSQRCTSPTLVSGLLLPHFCFWLCRLCLKLSSVLFRSPPPPVWRPHRRPRPVRRPGCFFVNGATAATAASAVLSSTWSHDVPLPDHVSEPTGQHRLGAASARMSAARSCDFVVFQGQSQVTFGGVTYYDTMQQQAQPKPSPPRRTSQPVTVKPPPPEVPFASE